MLTANAMALRDKFRINPTIISEEGAFAGVRPPSQIVAQPKPQMSMMGAARPDKTALIGAALRDLDWTVGSGNDLALEQQKQAEQQKMYSAQQMKMQEQAEKAEMARKIGETYGERAMYAYLNNPEEFGKQMAAHSAPKEYSAQTDAFGRPMSFDKTTGQFGDPIGTAKPMDVAPQNRLYDPVGNQTVLGPEEGYVARQDKQLGIDQQNVDIRRMEAMNPKPLVQVNNAAAAGEGAFQKTLGENYAKNFQTIDEGGQKAQVDLANITVMEDLLDSIDYTGFGGDSLMKMQQLARMFGIETPDLPAKELMQKLSQEMALSMKEQLPGPMSDGDRKFLLALPPNLNNTDAGNAAMLYVMRKKAERQQMQEQSLRQANPKTVQEYQAWLEAQRNWEEQNPIFDEKSRIDLYKALSGG